jgi:hypothetical protein
MGFNSVFKGLIKCFVAYKSAAVDREVHESLETRMSNV